MGGWFDDKRDRVTIERELRILARVRNDYREDGHMMPPMGPVDALLDELLELAPRINPLVVAFPLVGETNKGDCNGGQVRDHQGPR
jgi:hypothetical protein